MFAGFSIVLLLHVLFTFCGFYGNDDINYARLAAELVHKGKLGVSYTDHFPLRWVTIYAAAFFYKLFGFTEWATALFSYGCFVLSALLIYQFLKGKETVLLFAAYAMFFLSFAVIFYAHRLLPDTGICLFVFSAYFFYHQKRFYNSRGTITAILFATAWFLAVLTKETIIITIPLWLFLLVTDIKAKRNGRFWVTAFIFFSVLTGLYLLYFNLTTGDWLFRYHVLNRNSELSGGITYSQQAIIITVKRLFYTLWEAFLFNGDIEYLIFAICAFVYRRSLFADAAHRHIVIAFMMLLLSANFMTYSVDAYNPLPPDPRHFIFLIPFAVIPGAYMVRAYFADPRKYILVLILFILADIWLITSSIGATRYVYFLITLSLLLALIFQYCPVQTSIKQWIPLIAVAGLALNYVNDFIRPRYPYYFDQRSLVKGYFTANTKDATVYSSDGMTAELSDFFLGFTNNRIQFKDLHLCKQFLPNAANQYLLINGGYETVFKQQADSLFLSGDNSARVRLIQQKNAAFLYAVNDTIILHELKTRLPKTLFIQP